MRVSRSLRTGYLLSCSSVSVLVLEQSIVCRSSTYLAIQRVDLARQEPVGLLGVRVVKEVVLDLLRLGGHLCTGISGGVSRCKCRGR